MQNIGLCVVEGRERLLSQSVKISTTPVMNATGEHPSASYCDSSNYRSTGAELYFWEIGHLHRGTTSKQHYSMAPNSPANSPAHTLLNTTVLHLPLSQIKFIF